ncbi:MAG: S8 family peptidase [Chloroflexi bacterium]|nr:S8 family peptidase [Chloroflexota bacterium]MCY4248650.1 S8 family peptidase [Chloroflexota bacterium]
MVTYSRLMTLLLLALLCLPVAASEFPPGMQPTIQQLDSTRIDLVEGAQPTGNWVIHFDPDTPPSEKLEYLQRIGADLDQDVVERIAQLDIWVVDASERFDSQFSQDVELLAGDFYFDSDVALVEQDFLVSVAPVISEAPIGIADREVDFAIPPNDPDYDRQWALPHIQAEQAWREMGDLQPMTVAVIDTGVCMTHEDLQGRVLSGGYDFVDNDDDPEDVFGHGCSVAGIIAANTNNGIGIAGFANNSQILPVRVLGPSGSGSMADVAAGIVYAADNDADIINLSLGSMVGSQVTKDAVEYAMGKGVTVIASAGNSGGGLPGYPARYEGVVAVGAIDSDGKRSSFSNKGGDIWAPGRDVHTIYLDNGYKALNGTSFSAPYVAAMAAVLQGMGERLHLDGGDMTWACMRNGACEAVPGS